ncbi:MAG: apolipoprotein N-acyltransferase [Acidimicrobiia bacterium]
MISLLLALVGGVVSGLAFPRFGPGLLIVPGIALFLWGLRSTSSRFHGMFVGATYGFSFFMVLMWWSIELGLIALIPLAIVQSSYFWFFGWWLAGHRDAAPGIWAGYAVAIWSLVELVRYNFPFSGLEWGGAGYALSGLSPVRSAASLIGTSGWTVLVVGVAAGLVLVVRVLIGRATWSWWLLVPFAMPALAIGAALVLEAVVAEDAPEATPVAIVQGSTPCPFEKCPPDERLRTFQQHLALTGDIDPGAVDLVVWAEGSSGSFNADPVQNEEIGEAIGDEARRIGAWFLVGTDRPVSEENWINANVVINDSGEIVGEYRKQQGVPFGEYIPFRPLFDWIPDLSQVPRDMIPGEGPVVFDHPDFVLGSVISFEGSFPRYARGHVLAGAQVIVIATNEGSYGMTAVSDQFIGMTRMRAAELGVPVIHAAVTGKSVIIDRHGVLTSDASGLGTTEIVYAEVQPGSPTLYARLGDWLMYLAALSVLFVVWRQRRLLVSTEQNL